MDQHALARFFVRRQPRHDRRPDQAKRQVADQLFAAQVYQPWVALQFGGLRHCVDSGRLDDDGFPRPVSPHDPAADVCRDHLQAGRDGHGGYAPRFLRYPPGTEERNAEYEALKNGRAPEDDRQFAGYLVDKADAPAVDIQQAGGAFQRLTLALVVFLAALGMVCLLGFLALAVILAQIIALVLLGFAPVALVIGIFPRGGHEFFRNWLGKLATAIFIKALYSLVIAIVVAVSAALARPPGRSGSCSRSRCRRSSTGRSSRTASRSPPASSPPPPALATTANGSHA